MGLNWKGISQANDKGHVVNLESLFGDSMEHSTSRNIGRTLDILFSDMNDSPFHLYMIDKGYRLADEFR